MLCLTSTQCTTTLSKSIDFFPFPKNQHYLENPPAHGARAGLAAKMNMLAHPKGPMWVCRNGADVNLGGSGSKSRAIINGLTCIQEVPDDSDDAIQVVGIAKGSARDSGIVKMPMPLNWPFSAPSDCYPYPVEMMARRTRSRANAMMLDSSINAHGCKKHALCSQRLQSVTTPSSPSSRTCSPLLVAPRMF